MAASSDTAGVPVRIAVFDEGAIRLEQIQLPGRAPGEIDVRVSSAAICGSDMHTVLGHRPAPVRAALGHEAVGRVVALDAGSRDLRGAVLNPGDRVALSMMSSCGRCDRCRAGLSMKCRTVLKYGHESVAQAPHATGMLADHVRLLPSVPLLRVPDDVPDVVMVSAGCAVATAAAVVRAAQPDLGEPVLVLGAGAVGYYCAAMLASLGCLVRVREPALARRATLAGTGAVVDDGDGPPPRVVVEASGHPDAFIEAVTAVDTGGHVVAAGSVSPGSSSVTVDPALLVTRRIQLSGIHNYAAQDFLEGVDWLLAHGRMLNLEELLSSPYSLADIEAAFVEMARGRSTRVLVVP